MAVDPNELYDQLMRQNAAEQDIQAIAKQISDHAEAIYQTWKSKGLTPTELLHLHASGEAKDKPTSNTTTTTTTSATISYRQQQMPNRSAAAVDRNRSSSTPDRTKSGPNLSPVELLASPQLEATLEELVNSFVQEDKARLAARARTASPAPSSPGTSQPSASPMQTVIKRFENKVVTYESARRQPSAPESATEVSVKTSPITFQEAVQSASRGPVSESVDTVKSRAQRFASRIEMANAALASTPSWPVKRTTSTSTVTTTTVVKEVTHKVEAVPAVVVMPSSTEVDKEEERLVNALKTGQVINEAPATTEHFLMVKKARERQQQQQHHHHHHQQPVRAASVPGTEEELATLVDRLRESQSSTGRSVSASRESSPALLGLRDGSPSRSSSPRSFKLSDTVPVAGVSTVDYAKVRFQAAQANPLTQQRLEDSRSIGKAPNTPQPNVVSETRSRFEGTRPATNNAVPWRTGGPATEWSHVRPVSEPHAKIEVAQPQQMQQPTGLNLEALRRMKARKMRKSPEPQQSNSTSPTSSPLPHPELTVQQRQHLRERINLHGPASGAVQYTSTGIPIRPFLTRGSVAERVLLFEKCPTAIVASSSQMETVRSQVPSSTSGNTGSSASSSANPSPTEAVQKTKRAGSPAPQSWRHSSDAVQSRSQAYVKDNNKENRSTSSNTSSSRSSLHRQAKSNNNLLLPRFYYPMGRPISKEQMESSLQRLATAFQQLPNCQASREHFGAIAKACGCPFYWKSILYIAAGGDKLGHVSQESFTDFWKKIISSYHDEAARFVQLLTMINPSGSRPDGNLNSISVGATNGAINPSGRSHLVPEDFVPLVQDVVDTHPGLTFLKEATEFHSRYVHTVIARIFYNVNRSWSGQITLSELRHSNLMATIRLLEDEEDINQITDYFSYEHFYVIYCKFWELDKDHDLFIDKKDLARHNDHALSSKIIDRIFSGAVTRGALQNNKLAAKFGTANHNANNINSQPRMSYTEFVWFLISEEDKRHPTAIEYWFRCMDLDGDGYLSMYELEYFYEEQLQRMESLGIETLPFEDCLCQMLDMIHPTVPGKVSLNDLKRCQMTPIFFDTFFNLEKYLDHEQRDPFASQRDPDSENGDEIVKVSDWDRYAAEEYELLVAEEGGPDHNDDMFMREEMAAADEENGGPSVPLSMERDVIMSESSDLAEDHQDDYGPIVGHPLGNHRSLFSVTPCSIEYQY